MNRRCDSRWTVMLFVGVCMAAAACGGDPSGGGGDAGSGDAAAQLDAVVVDADTTHLFTDDDGDGYSEVQGDCDDTDHLIHPLAVEICSDGVDNNCNGAMDGAEPDEDGDGFGPCNGDCDDEDPDISPAAEEIPDGLDNNCDGITDADYDSDGFTEADGDCDDDDPDRHPDAVEHCFDGVDNNCNGHVDGAEPDGDGDGTGPCDGDCDDTNNQIGPLMPEIPGDGIDNNCDFLVDQDIDSDGWTVANGDCDDNNPDINPSAIELCDDAIDNDCDGTVDQQCFDPCAPNDDMTVIFNCSQQAPAGSFTPDTQWTWAGSGAEIHSIVTPLVANMNDDNADGSIDMCDIPDVLVVASAASGSPNSSGHIYLLAGDTGAMQLMFPMAVDSTVTPAIGDIDSDGLPEVVTALVGGAIVAFDHDGTHKWTSSVTWSEVYSGAIALADMDNDGDVEIIAGNMLFDHGGNHIFTAPQPAGNWSATTAADLDGDGDLEMVLGHAAYHHTGAPLYVNTAVLPGYPQVANLDSDAEPEVLINNQNGITLLNHDGSVIYTNLRPTGATTGFTTWLRPSTIHDFDGDGVAEYAVSSANQYACYEADASILWQAPVSDQSGIAAGTAFDFLGDGVAEAMYADEQFMFIFDGAGQVLMQTPRTSGTLSEYPVVADIDNDGSAEIVVVSNSLGGQPSSVTVQVIRDVQDRWIQARRIWNQHTYHVTNVREDGTIPQFETPSWTSLNTFRTNAQIENGGVCTPN